MGKIRESSTVPIIIISAKDTDSDKTLGLGLGADDYITKPFSVTEVLARIKANIRRTIQYASVTSMQQPVIIKGDQTIFFFLLIVITVLTLVVLYQRFAFRRGIQIKLIQISRKLEAILKSDSNEKVMIFTDEPVLMELTGEINHLLFDRQKLKAEFKRGEIASKKMLANISHDIKTPLTVILV